MRLARPSEKDARSYPGTYQYCRDWCADRGLLLPLRKFGWLPTRLRERGLHEAPAGGLAKWLDASIPVFLGVCAFGLVLSLLDPFGLARASKAQSERLSARLLAPFYESDAQSQIAVVLIDDLALDRHGMAWPLRYSEYEALVRRVLAHAPRAVYLDVLLEQARSYDDSREDAVADLHAQLSAPLIDGRTTPPVFFGVSAPDRRSIFSMPGGVQDVATSWQGVGGDYPLRLDPKTVYAADWRAEEPRMREDDPRYRSVALTLYEVACAELAAPGCAQTADRLDIDAQRHPLSVQWGAMQPTVAAGHDVSPCMRTSSPTPGERWATMARLAWRSLLSGLSERSEETGRTACAYPLTVHMEQLSDSRLLRQDDTTPGLLENRVVLIGTHLIGLDDRVLSPVHQQIPGVFLHAMALDNLMTWGDRRIHRVEGMGVALDVLTAMLMSLACGAVLVQPWSRPVRWLMLCIAPVAVGIGMIFLSQYGLRQPPQDWLGVLWLAWAMAIYLHQRLRGTKDHHKERHDAWKDDADPSLHVAGVDAGGNDAGERTGDDGSGGTGLRQPG